MTVVTSNTHDPVDRLAEDFLARYRRGERPSLSDYAQQFPDVADQVVDVIQVLLLMENLGAEQAGENENDIGPMPERLGEYRILRELGRGGMGVVYEAIQEELGRHVAIKVLPTAALIKTTQLERFRREAKTAAKLHHTNIVPVFGVGAQDGIHFYAMQYIQGQGLDTILKEVRQQRTRSGSKDTLRDAAATTQLSTISGYSNRHDYARSVAQIGWQIADALAHAHTQGVLHRDIKPSNILLDQESRAWLSDFGLAQVEATDQLTGTGEIVGTLRYIAPERFKRQGDARSDIYSLGMTLYELLTIQPAFQESDRAKLIHQILKEEPPSPRSIDPGMPRDLETIILKTITKEPEHRYQTCQELADDLRRFLSDRPVAARRLQWWEISWRWVGRNRVISLTALAAFTALTIGLSLTYWQWQRAESEAKAKRLAAEAADVQRGKAEANAALAWRTLRGMLDGIKANEKTTPEMKRALLNEALKLHQEYLSQVDDPPRSLEMGRIATDLGLLYHHTGQHKNAQSNYNIAIGTFDSFLRIQPGHREATLGLVASLTYLAKSVAAEALQVSKPPTEALAPASKSAEMLRSMLKDDPGNQIISFRLIYSLEALAVVQQRLSGDWESSLREAQQLMTQLGPVPGQLTMGQLEIMATCHKTYATVLVQEERLDQALIEAEAAYRAVEVLTQNHPEADNIQQLFSDCSAALGVIYTKKNDYGRSEELHRRNIDIYRSMLLRDGANTTFHSNLGGELNNLAIAQGKLDKVKEALDNMDEAIKEQRMALRQFPNHKQYLGFLYNHYKTQTRLHLQNKDHAQAATAAKQLATISYAKGGNHYETALSLPCCGTGCSRSEPDIAGQE